jgi:hypothetical protein
LRLESAHDGAVPSSRAVRFITKKPAPRRPLSFVVSHGWHVQELAKHLAMPLATVWLP